MLTLPSFQIPSPIKHWKNYALAILIATNLLAFGCWRDTSKTLADERIAHAKEVATFVQAQKDANENAQRTKARLEKEAKDNAQKAEAQYSDLLGQYRANLLRYQQATRSGPSGPTYNRVDPAGLPLGTSPSTPVPSGPGEGSLIISFADADICAVNTARLQAAHDWAKNLPKR